MQRNAKADYSASCNYEIVLVAANVMTYLFISKQMSEKMLFTCYIHVFA